MRPVKWSRRRFCLGARSLAAAKLVWLSSAELAQVLLSHPRSTTMLSGLNIALCVLAIEPPEMFSSFSPSAEATMAAPSLSLAEHRQLQQAHSHRPKLQPPQSPLPRRSHAAGRAAGSEHKLLSGLDDGLGRRGPQVPTVASCAHWPSGDEKWDAYRIADVVHKGMAAYMHLWPSSIAAEYARKWCKLPNSDQHHMANITLLAEIIHGRFKATNDVSVNPSDSEVIVHLRLGDVIDTDVKGLLNRSVDDIWENGDGSSMHPEIHWLRSRGYYEHFIASNLPARVTLIGSAQHVRGLGYAPHPYNRSIAYASRVQRLFAEAGWQVTCGWNRLPDDDLAHMATAAAFLPSSRSGYSKIAMAAVLLRGGRVWSGKGWWTLSTIKMMDKKTIGGFPLVEAPSHQYHRTYGGGAFCRETAVGHANSSMQNSIWAPGRLRRYKSVVA